MLGSLDLLVAFKSFSFLSVFVVLFFKGGVHIENFFLIFIFIFIFYFLIFF